MTLTLLPLPIPKRVKCDTRLLLERKEETHRKLKHEMEEKKISAELVATHNERVRQRRSTPHYLKD